MVPLSPERLTYQVALDGLKMAATLFLSNWLAHDYIHLRQIIKIKYAYLDNFGSEPLTYAGDW